MGQNMKDVILDTLLDGLKLLPFLFIAFLIIELIEHKFSKKTTKIIKSSGKFGPIIGSLLGAIPQCGFSVVATNLYVTRIITLGTLISIYLSTSDEMLPILLSENFDISKIILILIIKIIIGFTLGFLIDILFRPKKADKENYSICDHEHCHCEEGLLKSSLIHTIKTMAFILLTSFVLNIVMHYYGEDILSKILFKNNIFGSYITSLVGLIPNCGASVIITELFVNNAISFGALIGGLLTGSGIALLVLFKENKNIKENMQILLMMYLIGSIVGMIIDLFTILI